jgi:hypothetical protein
MFLCVSYGFVEILFFDEAFDIVISIEILRFWYLGFGRKTD